MTRRRSRSSWAERTLPSEIPRRRVPPNNILPPISALRRRHSEARGLGPDHLRIVAIGAEVALADGLAVVVGAFVDPHRGAAGEGHGGRARSQVLAFAGARGVVAVVHGLGLGVLVGPGLGVGGEGVVPDQGWTGTAWSGCAGWRVLV